MSPEGPRQAPGDPDVPPPLQGTQACPRGPRYPLRDPGIPQGTQMSPHLPRGPRRTVGEQTWSRRWYLSTRCIGTIRRSRREKRPLLARWEHSWGSWGSKRSWGGHSGSWGVIWGHSGSWGVIGVTVGHGDWEGLGDMGVTGGCQRGHGGT